MNHRKSCVICGIYYSADYNTRSFMSIFPCGNDQEERCRKWLKQTGRTKLLDLPRLKLTRKYVCEKHFTARDFNKNKTRLRKTAIPTQNLNFPPLDDELLKNWRFFDIAPSRARLNLPHDHNYYTKPYRDGGILDDDVIGEKRKTRVTNSTRNTDYPVDEDSQQSNGNHFDNNDINCTEVEYLEEDADSDDSDDSADIKPDIPSQKPDIEDPTIMFEQDFKLTLDDVDFLFLSYARTFRSLAKQFQTMLKLDIAKLFARYEMKNNLNTTEGCKQEEPPSEPVKPSTPDETEPPLAATVTQSVENPPQFVVKPPQFVVKPSQFVVKPSQFVLKPHQTVQPPQPVALPSPDKIANFIPAKEPNKKIFKRVPLQAVMSGVIAKTITSSPQVTLAKPNETTQQVILVPQVTQAKPKETVNTPQIILVPPSRQAAIQQTELPQITGTNELEKNTVNKYIRVDSVPKQFDATVKLERLNTDASTLSSRSDSPQPPAPKVMKYYVPKKGPAYAIFSKNSVQLPTVQDTKDSFDSDLDMEVTEQVRTETVFVPTDHVGYCEEEEASDSSVSSS